MDFEINFEDFNKILLSYFFGGEVNFKDADGGTELTAFFQEEEVDNPVCVIKYTQDKWLCNIPESDWHQTVKYVFTNTNLMKDDVRLSLLKELKSRVYSAMNARKLLPSSACWLLFDWLMSLKETLGFEEIFEGNACKTRRLAPQTVGVK